MTTIVTQVQSASLDDVQRQLREAFSAARAAVEAADPILFVVNGADLLGQGTVNDAAVATGLLGLMRALIFEGAGKGWRATVIAVDDPAQPPEAVMEIAEQPVLNGQVLNLCHGRLGKVIP